MRFLYELALAHRKHEGWFPGSLSQRNRNPGNLRLTRYQERAYKAVQGERGFARFPNHTVGFHALRDDLRAKITGYSAHIDYSKNPTLLDYIKVYAPRADRNDPVAYAMAIVSDMNKAGYPIQVDTPLAELAGYITQKPFPLTATILFRRLQRLLARAKGAVKRRLQKRIDRLV